ncbi:MAG: MBL fold metallo-hydrolase [archaeon]|nr:MBL fold metallo-hydrolase [archaeon]
MFGIRPSSSIKKGKEIIKDIFAFNEFPNLDCNIYLLKSQVTDEVNDYELTLIDAGNALNSKNLVEGIKSMGLEPSKISKIIITHEHLDHILGIYNIPELIGKKIEIYAFGETMSTIKEADENIIAPKSLGINVSMFGVQLKKLPVIELVEGTILKIGKKGKFELEVIYTPGHSLGSMTLYERNLKIMFPGDVVFCGGSFGRYDFPGGSISELKKSIKFLLKYDVSILCPGHMYYSKIGFGSEEIKKADKMINSFYF